MRTLTENQSLTYASSGDARLDFLFHAIEGSSLERTTDLLQKSWDHSPLDTMKLVMNLRDIRRGKGIRSQFLICFKWLYENQLDSLLANLKLVAEFGCWKDFLNLLLIALFGELTYDCSMTSDKKEPVVSTYDRVILRTLPKEKRRELSQTKTSIREVKRRLVTTDYSSDPHRVEVTFSTVKNLDQQEKPLEYKSRESYFPEKKSNMKAFYKLKTGREKIKLMNQYRQQYFANYYRDNGKFKRLYDAIVNLFASQLLEDYNNSKAGKSFSLAPKWLPNPGRHFDKYLFILLPIAKRFFELEVNMIQQIEVAKRSEDLPVQRLFQKVYTELRRKMQIPEIGMSAKSWDEVQYFCVPSVAMLRYKAVFVRNDFERFNKFVQSKPVKGAALTPGDLVLKTINIAFHEGSLYGGLIENLSQDKVLEEKVVQSQWQSLIDDIKSKGSLLIKDSLAICDVSGSMLDSSQKVKPMYGSIGLTLMLLQISSGPWSNRCISFSEEPKLFEIDLKDALKHQIKRMMDIEFGYSTNLNKAFALILDYAKERNIPDSEMPKVLFIFTDMEFDVALPEKTNFESCQIQYQQAGYAMPLVVFWNLKGDKSSKSTPVQCFQEGVFLLSGYSAQTLNFFFSCKDLKEMTPLTMLLKIINDPRYDCVTVAQSATVPMVVDGGEPTVAALVEQADNQPEPMQ